MTAATATAPLTAVTQIPNKVIPVKLAWMGETGAGKTASAALFSAALSKELHGGAPVWVTDPELGWQFARRVIFKKEKIELVQRTVPTFKAMLEDLRAAERAGACVWNVELGKIWKELLITCQRKCGNRWGQELSKMWGDYVNLFLNSPIHCMGLGRVGVVEEEILKDDEQNPTDTIKIKVRDKMMAGGSNDFGYEPNLVIRLSLEKKPRRQRSGEVREGEGRMIHRADVIKDRTWELNGAVFRWSDKVGYEPGGYRAVWTSLKPHVVAVQETAGVTLDINSSSEGLIDNSGNGEWQRKREQKTILFAEITALMDTLWGGSAVAAKQMRMKVTESIFGFKSKEAAEAASSDKIERGFRILQAFERRTKREPDILGKGDLEILAQLDIDIREHDQNAAAEADMPF